MSSSATEELVVTEKAEGLAVVTLNRPDALNAISMAMREAIVRTFEALQEDPDVEVIILTGAGRAFTAGLDLKEMGSSETPPGDRSKGQDIGRALSRFDGPIIGAINGFAITGGLELALMCDFLIASRNARFADTHARAGLVPGWGLTQRLPRLIGINRAKELSLTGDFLDAELACQWGLVNRVVEPDELIPVCRQLAKDILGTDAVSRNTVRRLMNDGWRATMEAGLEMELAAAARHAETRVSANSVTAITGEVQRRGRGRAKPPVD